MSKIIKIVITNEVIVPDNAEIVRIKDDDGIVAEYIRVAGKLAMPMIQWVEYVSAARREEEAKALLEASGVKTGMGFSSIEEDFYEENLKEMKFPEYYFEETGKKLDDTEEEA